MVFETLVYTKHGSFRKTLSYWVKLGSEARMAAENIVAENSNRSRFILEEVYTLQHFLRSGGNMGSFLVPVRPSIGWLWADPTIMAVMLQLRQKYHIIAYRT